MKNCKNLLIALLVSVLCLGMAACGGSASDGPGDAPEQEASAPEPEPEPTHEELAAARLRELEGTYLLVEFVTEENGDMTEYVTSAFESRSFYEYLVFGEDGTSEFFAYSEDSGTEMLQEFVVGDYDFDTDEMIVSGTGERIAVDGERIILESGGDRMVFQRTDEEL